MNFYDSGKISDLLKKHGYDFTDEQENADLIVLNTCHIREKASEKLFSDLGRIKKLKNKKEIKIAVTGCVAQAEGSEIIKRAPYVDLVVGPQAYHRLPEMIRNLSKDKRTLPATEFLAHEKFDNLPNTEINNGPSAFVSIHEGCDKFCTFCVVPYTRGSEYSRPISEIIREVISLTDIGVREIILLGQNVNSWHGNNLAGKEKGLGYLIYEIAKINKIERIRYTTSHPLDMDDELIEAHRDIPKLMPYLHLPIQSGSNKILQNMNRRHTASEYIKIIEKVRKTNPNIALSGDFIVGFPNESEDDFKETLRLIKEVKYAQSYSFIYSSRPGTPASVMDMQVPEKTKKLRLYELQTLLNTQQLEFNTNFLNKEIKVLLEKKGKSEDQIMGRSPEMQSVYMNSSIGNIGEIKKVKVNLVGQSSLKAISLRG